MNAPPRFQFYDYHPATSDLRREVILGLSRKRRATPPKFLYDEEGCRLFEGICDTPEYYPTRTEVNIIEQHIDEMAQYVDENCCLIEPGSGNCLKVRQLLPVIRPLAYMPLDISRAALHTAASQLASDFPWLDIHAVCADFTTPLELPEYHGKGRPIVFFPGSSIGNFEPQQAITFLSRCAAMAQPDGGMLVGVDLKKSHATLNAAYNDAQGVTAAFNLNLLTRLNRDLEATFDTSQFRHHAYYNEAERRVEMHLVSEIRQQVRIGSWRFDFQAGESIHTESSYKYTVEEFQELAKKAGFHPIRVWTDPEGLFSVHYLEVREKRQ